jgi:hypothetical protein
MVTHSRLIHDQEPALKTNQFNKFPTGSIGLMESRVRWFALLKGARVVGRFFVLIAF